MPATPPLSSQDPPGRSLAPTRHAERDRLRALAVLFIGAAGLLVVVHGVLWLITGHDPLLVVAAMAAVYALGIALAWRRYGGRAPVRFATGLAAATLVVEVLVTPLFPEVASTLAVAPLLPVLVALPYLSAASLRRFLWLSLATMVAITALPSLSPPPPVLDPMFVLVLRLWATAIVGGVALLLLWQHRSRLAQARDELDLLVTMSREVARTLDPRLVGALTARHLALASGADACVVSRWRPGESHVRSFGVHPESGLPGLSESYELDQFPLTRAVLEEQRVVVVSIEDLAADPAEVAFLRAIGHRTMAMIPLVARGETIGLVEVTATREGRFDERTMSVATTLAAEAAMALENAQLYEELRHQAFHDTLTDLANRALFRDRLEHALARNARRSASLAVLFIDVDDFKTINDRHGHAVGDRVLQVVGERLRGCLRSADTGARLGGDEFAVLLEDLVVPVEAGIVARRVLEALGAPIELDGRGIVLSASVGVAMAGVAGDTAADLIRNADYAMYHAKKHGKARVEVFRPSMRAGDEERRRMEALLRVAADRGELLLQYQPIVDLATTRTVGVEALVRWDGSDGHRRQPADFIGLAEETGAIVSIGRWVIEEACRQTQDWQRRLQRPDLLVSVNLSPRQFEDPGLVGDIEHALATSGLPATALIVEITESLLLQHTATVLTALGALRERGVRIAVDDFGSGYASLGFLQRFPVDVLKVERSFVERASIDGDGGVLARAVVGIGQALGMDVIAEGIEREEQREALRRYGCAMGQGFLFAPPLDAATLESRVRSEAAGRPASPAPADDEDATRGPSSDRPAVGVAR